MLRQIKGYALSKRLLSTGQLINPDPRVKNLGIVNLPKGQAQRKPAFTLWEQEQYLALVKKEDTEFLHDH